MTRSRVAALRWSLIAGAFLSLVIAWLVRAHPFLSVLAVFVSAILAGPPCLVVLSIAAVLRLAGARRTSPASEQLLTAAVCGLLLIVVQPVGVIAADLLYGWEVGRAKEWAEVQCANVERFCAEHGEAPENISDVADLSTAPLCVRNGALRYGRDSSGFWFVLNEDLSFSRWSWHSSTRTWSYGGD